MKHINTSIYQSPQHKYKYGAHLPLPFQGCSLEQYLHCIPGYTRNMIWIQQLAAHNGWNRKLCQSPQRLRAAKWAAVAIIRCRPAVVTRSGSSLPAIPCFVFPTRWFCSFDCRWCVKWNATRLSWDIGKWRCLWMVLNTLKCTVLSPVFKSRSRTVRFLQIFRSVTIRMT